MDKEIKAAVEKIFETEESQAFRFRDLQKRRENWLERVNSEDVIMNDGYTYIRSTSPELLRLEERVLKEFEYAHIYTIMVHANIKDNINPSRNIARAEKSLERADKALDKYEHEMSINEEIMGIINFKKMNSDENN